MSYEIKRNIMKDIEESLLNVVEGEKLILIKSAMNNILNNYEIKEKIVSFESNVELFNHVIKEFENMLHIWGKSEKTIAQYSGMITRLFNWKKGNVLEYTQKDIVNFISMLIDNNVTMRSCNTYRNYISSFYNWAMGEGYITVNPCEHIKAIKYKKTLKLPFTDIEIETIRNSNLTVMERAIVEFLLASGVRAEELHNLNISDIDFNQLRVHVRDGKGGKDRLTYINNYSAYYLKKYLETRKDNTDYLFLGRNKIDRFSYDAIERLMVKLRKKSGVNKIHCHRFRRTFATNLYNKGMELHEIQRLMGHDNIQVTMGYITGSTDALGHSYSKIMG